MASLLNMSGGSLLKTSGESSYIDWLKSLGCICWLPLSEEGDLLDRISGKSLELTGSGSMVWDNNVGMYLVTSPSNGNSSHYVAFLDNGMNKQTFSDNTLTVIATVQRDSSGIAPLLSPLSNDSETKSALGPAVNATLNMDNWGNSNLHKIAREYNDSVNRSSYLDGVFTTISAYNNYIPKNWNITGNGLCVGMLRFVSNECFNRRIYLKNILIFDKCLTVEQIESLKGYER